jgi:hypothetical protein
MLLVKNISGKGRGIIINEGCWRDTVLDIAHVVPVGVANNGNSLLPHPICNYAFDWRGKECIAMSMISFVNHSSKPNCSLKCNYEDDTISLIAKVDIKKHSELTIDYDCKKLWFTPVEEE